MSLANLSKKILPHKIRNAFGVYGIKAVSKSALTTTLFSLAFDFRTPGVKMLPDGLCSRRIGDRDILCHRDGFRIFHEIFEDNIYEKYWKPEPGDIVLDLGAYVGMYSYRAAQLVGDSGMVVAVEPNDSNLKLLRQNLAGMKNTRIIEAAIGEDNRLSWLHVSPKSTCHSILGPKGDDVPVEIIAIDSLVRRLRLPRVDIIKMDVEGAELLALAGAKETLKGDVKLAIEYYHTAADRHQMQEDLTRTLTENGFHVRSNQEYVYADKE